MGEQTNLGRGGRVGGLEDPPPQEKKGQNFLKHLFFASKAYMQNFGRLEPSLPFEKFLVVVQNKFYAKKKFQKREGRRPPPPPKLVGFHFSLKKFWSKNDLVQNNFGVGSKNCLDRVKLRGSEVSNPPPPENCRVKTFSYICG